MKRKLTYVLLLTLTFATIFSIGAHASFEESANGTEQAVEEALNHSESAEEPSEAEREKSSEAEMTVTDALYDTVTRYFNEIVSSLTLIFSLVIAFCYRKGLLPLLNQGLNAITGHVRAVREENEKAVEEAKQSAERTGIAVAEIKAITETCEALTRTTMERVDALEKERISLQDFSSVLLCEVDMLSEIFLSSSLPEYRKKAVAERIAQMKNALSAADGTKGGEEGDA